MKMMMASYHQAADESGSERRLRSLLRGQASDLIRQLKQDHPRAGVKGVALSRGELSVKGSGRRNQLFLLVWAMKVETS